MALALVGIGSNIGARSAQLDEAVRLLSQTESVQLSARQPLARNAPHRRPTRTRPLSQRCLAARNIVSTPKHFFKF